MNPIQWRPNRRSVLAMACACAFSPYAMSSEGLPPGTVNLVVANPPGGASDTCARVLAASWTNVLKQPVVVQNRPGMGGAIGTGQVARGKADGLTVLLALSAVVVAPEAERVSGRKALYEVEQLEPVAMISSEPMVILVRTESPWQTLEDLINTARAKPGVLNYSSSGNFGPIHLSVEMLANKADFKATQVPFGGGGPAVLAVLSGQVDFTTAAPSVAVGHIAGGRVRALAVSGGKRSEMLPEVKTYRELGYDAEFTNWAGLYVPKGTPAGAVKALRDSVAATVKLPEFQNALRQASISMDYRDAAEFAKYAAEDGRRMVEAVRAIGKVD